MNLSTRARRAASVAAVFCTAAALASAGTASAVIPKDGDHIRKGDDSSSTVQRYLCPPRSICLFQHSNQRGQYLTRSCRFGDAGKRLTFFFGRSVLGGISSYRINASRAVLIKDVSLKRLPVRGIGNVPGEFNDKISSAYLYC